MTHPIIKCRVLPNNSKIYYLQETGQSLSNINAITIDDYPDSVFTVFNLGNEFYTRIPQKTGIAKFSLYDIMNKLNKTVRLVS